MKLVKYKSSSETINARQKIDCYSSGKMKRRKQAECYVLQARQTDLAVFTGFLSERKRKEGDRGREIEMEKICGCTRKTHKQFVLIQ